MPLRKCGAWREEHNRRDLKMGSEENIRTQGEEVTGGNLHDELCNLYNHLILLKSDYQRGRVGQDKQCK